MPGRPAPLLLPHDGAPLQLLQRVRDEAHRFAIEFHRGRRDKAMTRSVLDDLPGVGPDAQAGDARALRHARSGSSRPAARSSRPCRGCRARSPARCTSTCTGSTDPWHDEPVTKQDAPARPRHHHRLLRRRQVAGDGLLRGRGLLLRRQPAAGDDRRARRPVRARGSKVERAAVVSDVRGGDYFEALADVLDSLQARRAAAPAPVPRGVRGHAAEPLQGDAPPPPAGAGRSIAPAIEAERELLDAVAQRADVVIDTTDLTAARPAPAVADKMLPRAASRGSPSPSLVRLQARRRRATPTCSSTCASCRTRTTSPSCATLTGLDARGARVRRAATAAETFFERLEPLLDYLLPAVRGGGQGAPDGRHRLHRRPPPLRRDRRAAGARYGARDDLSSTSCTGTSTRN